MATPAAVRRHAAEADRLLKELNAKPGQVEQPPAAPAPAAEQPPAAPAPAAEQPPAAPQEPDYKQKFLVLKGKYDKEILELKVQISELMEDNRQLAKRLEQPAQPAKSDAPSKPSTLIKPEELTEYGEEFFDVVGRRAREVYEGKIADLEARIERLTGGSGRLDAATARQNVFSSLDDEVPGWQAINGDQRFLAWLADRDVFSGRTKRELLSEAFESNDAARVVKFFKAFQEDSPAPAPAARQPAVDAGTLVAPGTPRSGAPADAPGGGRIWTQDEINGFYTDVRRGKYPPERKAQIEADIIRAAAEGRVR